MRLLPTLLIATAIQAHAPARAAELALKRVMLSGAGVGYFEYEATIDGAATLGLDVKLDQVDDVLKSLVVFDDRGGVGSIELPGREQQRAAFGNVPFGPDDLASPLAFLNSLQGVEVTAEPSGLAGRLLRAEAVHEPAAPAASPASGLAPLRTRVTLLTAAGLQQFVLEDATAVQVADPALRDRIARALAATRRETAGDTRHLTLTSNAPPGTRRTIRVAYVAAAPVWKASYRLVLPAADADPANATARLQGWATLENASGADWSGVALSVQYGNPVTFRQAIYRSYFVTRPEVPVEVLGRILPDVDTRATAARPLEARARAAMPAPPPAPAPAPMAALQMEAPAPKLAMAAPAEAASMTEGAEETVFAVPAPVSLQAGHSASVPILDVALPAARIALATLNQPHPVAAIRLANTTSGSLPAGVLTLYDAEGAAPYAGDARLGGLPAGEDRLLPYAQDLRTTLAWREEQVQRLTALTAANGVLTATRRDRQLTHVTLTGPATAARRVLVEAARPPGATLAPGFAPATEETATAWRFAVELKPGETRALTLATDRDETQAITLLDDPDALATVLNLQGASDAARAALTGIATLRAQEAARAGERDQLIAQRAAVEADEERLRANLAAVQQGDAVRTRLVRQLDTDETRLQQLGQAITAAEAAAARAHQALAEAIAALRI
ncbi:MAG: hypothetical protein ACRYGM_18155 [Janthinobacterium lividum]